MLKITQYQGLIIKIADYKENAVIATVLTKEDKKNFIIRGAKKITSSTRNLSTILIHINFMATDGGTINTLTEAQIISNYTDIKSDFTKMEVAYAILEKVNIFSQVVNDKELFYNFVIDTLNLLNITSYSYLVLNIFEIKLLYLLGIAPQLNNCQKCGNKSSEQYLSIAAGGIFCDHCHYTNQHDLDAEETTLFKILYLVKWENLNEQLLSTLEQYKLDLNTFIDEYYFTHLDFKSSTKQILNKMKNVK